MTSFQFLALIDGNGATLSDVRCSQTGSTFECSAPLPRMSPGTHRFQLVAISAQGVQSSPSDTIMLNVVAGQNAPATDDSSSSTPCPSCASVETLARGLGRIDRLIALPDNDLLVLHEGRQVLRLREGVIAEAARVDPTRDSLTQWVDLDAHPDFSRAPFVFALTVGRGVDGSRSTSVIRMRAVGDALVEQVTVVPAIPVNSSAHPELSVGADGLLYVAIPQTEEGLRRDAYDGMLLRFTTDGGAAGNDAGTSPVLSYGVSRPGAMSWDVRQRLWLLERDEGANRASVLLPMSASAINVWPRRPNQIVWPPSLRTNQVSGLVFVNDTDGTRAYLTAGVPGTLLETNTSLDTGTLSEPRAVLGGTDAFDVTASAAGTNGELLVAGLSRHGEGSAIFRLTIARQR